MLKELKKHDLSKETNRLIINLPYPDWHFFGKINEKCRLLTYINIQDSLIRDKGCKFIASASWKFLKTLHLSLNEIT
jgi:hypothetical protein